MAGKGKPASKPSMPMKGGHMVPDMPMKGMPMREMPKGMPPKSMPKGKKAY